MGLIQLTTSICPVTLSEVKVQCRLDVDDDSENKLLESYMSAATKYCETRTHRAFMQSDWKWTGKNFPTRLDRDNCWRVPMAPLVSVTSVKYWSGSLLTMSTSDYIVDTDNIPGRIQFNNIPSVDDRPNAVQITFTAGYGAAGDSISLEQEAVPADIKQTILLIVGSMYENRQGIGLGNEMGNMKMHEEFVESQLSNYFLAF